MPRLHLAALLISILLAACGPDSGSSSPAASAWPAHRGGEYPPPAPADIEAALAAMDGDVDALAALLPDELITAVFDPLAFGVTLRDLSDPSLLAFQVRAALAQLGDGSRLEHGYHWYGHPDYNDAVALVPVSFHNRYGTRLYGEIVLPHRGQRAPNAGPYPVILALEGLNTNVAMYRWWHQVFADAGYLVFAFDFSGQGHSESEGDGDPGNNIEEAQDALSWLFNESPVAGYIDAGRVGVVGHSMGAIATLGLQAVDARIKAAVAAAPISEQSAPFDANPVPVMIQTGDHDGPIAPIPFLNPAVVRPVYEKLDGDRAFIVAEAASHAQHTNYPLLPTSASGLEVAAQYSLAWMDYQLRGLASAREVLTSAHPELSLLWDSELRLDGELTLMRGSPLPSPTTTGF